MKIGVFLEEDSYGACAYMAKSLGGSFQKSNHEVFYYNKKDLKNSLLKILRDAPDFTLSFMDTALSKGGSLLCDYLQIPHFTYLVDPSNCYFHHSQSSLTYLSSIDQNDIDFLISGGFTRVIQLPLAVDSCDFVPFSEKRKYPLAFIGSCWDYQEVEARWELTFTKEMANLMREVSKEVLAEEGVSHLTCLPKKLSSLGYDITKVPYADMQVNIGLYIRGFERVKVLQGIKKIPIHIWGSFRPKNAWQKYLKGQDNIHLHPPISYAESLKISSESQILLNSSPQFKQGLHDRAFSAPLTGSLLASVQTDALKAEFSNSACLCHPKKLDLFEEMLQEHLRDHNLRKKLVKRALDNVIKKHTWESRSKNIIHLMKDFIKNHKERICAV
jgi:spore maturation protein CgeB